MSSGSRKPARVIPARKTSSRAPIQQPADDTEKLMSDAKEKSKDSKTDLARPYLKLSPASQPVPHHDYSVHEITNVPAPIPDTGLPPPSVDTNTSDAVTALASRAPKTPATHSHSTWGSAFVPLPSLKTQNLTGNQAEEAASSSLVIRPTTTTLRSAAVTTSSSSDARDHTQHQNTTHLSMTAIIALAVGGGLLLVVTAVLVRLIKRPYRRRTPTPSLPIIHDGIFSNNNGDSEGSPIFGGKEYSSPILQSRSGKGNTGIWTWTQYHSGIPKPAPTVTVTRTSSQNQLPANNQTTEDGTHPVANDTIHDRGQNPGQYPFVGYGNSGTLLKTKSPAALQPVQNAITRAVSRLSTVSMSLYPNSPAGHSHLGVDVGLAIDGVTQDEPGNIMARRSMDRMMTLRNRTSMVAPGSYGYVKDGTELRRSQSFAYGGMEPTSPPASRGQFSSGRARIKSTHYTPGSYPRASTAAANHGKQRNVDHEHDGIRLEENKVERTDSRRGRELTSALGLPSPVPPSPQPTLYPDDSMSVIGEAKKVTLTGRNQKKPVPKAGTHNDSPPSDMAALGSLMMVDFAVSKSTASLVNIRPCEAARAREGHGAGMAGKSNLKKRVEDKPPRVPSPPPMPSLAQMALQHREAEGYGEYHSPTYSIYGLYDGDRKSCGLSYGY